MSKQCNCINSYYRPHRVDMCLIYGSKKEHVTAKAEQSPSVPLADATVIPPTSPITGDSERTVSSLESDAFSDDDVRSDSELPVADTVPIPEFEASNATLSNGNERCDCIMFRISKHRKSKCAWKNHLAMGLTGAAVASGAAILTSMLIGERNDVPCVPDDEPEVRHVNAVVNEDPISLKVSQQASQPASPLREVETVEHDWRQGDAEVPSQKIGGQTLREEDLEDEHATAARLAYHEAKRREREETCARLYAERVAEQRRAAHLKAQTQREQEEDERVAQWMEEAEFDSDTFKI